MYMQYGEEELTPWFHCINEKPVRNGMYETQVQGTFPGVFIALFMYWRDGDWYLTSNAGAVPIHSTSLKNRQWRGLLKNMDGDSK